MSTYKVMVDDNFHFMDESERYEHGTFNTLEEAVAAGRRIVDEDLISSYKPGVTATELYELYCSFGRDPYVLSVGGRAKSNKFRARSYARGRCKALTSERT